MGHSNTDETVPEHNFKQQTGQVQQNVETYEFPLRTSKESLCKRPTRLQTPFCSSSHKFCCCTHANQLGDDDLNRVRASENDFKRFCSLLNAYRTQADNQG